MAGRRYASARREAASAQTRRAILRATLTLLREAPDGPSVGSIAGLAGVSRLSVYHHFGSRAGVLAAVAGEAQAAKPAAGADLRTSIASAVAHWATDPALFRRVPEPPAAMHELATRLAAEDRLRPGCSLKEAEDVMAVVTSFAAFDRLYQDGRRPTSTVTEILMRMASSILHPST